MKLKNQIRQYGGKVDLISKQEISNISREVVSATSSEGFSSSQFLSPNRALRNLFSQRHTHRQTIRKVNQSDFSDISDGKLLSTGHS